MLDGCFNRANNKSLKFVLFLFLDQRKLNSISIVFLKSKRYLVMELLGGRFALSECFLLLCVIRYNF